MSLVGTYNCPDGRSVTYIKASASEGLIDRTTLIVLDRYLYDPKKNETTLIRSDSTSATGNILESLKGLPTPIPF